MVSAGGPVEIVTTTTAQTSTYAGLVRLVEQAQAGSAPFVRAADRMAILFVPLTLVLAAVGWLVSGDPVRAVAVLVVATPCPLLLAAPSLTAAAPCTRSCSSERKVEEHRSRSHKKLAVPAKERERKVRNCGGALHPLQPLAVGGGACC